MSSTLFAAGEALTDAGSTQLVLAALAGIAAIVLLITLLKLHPFLSLTIGSITVGVLAGVPVQDALTSF
ncbi:MAG: gluconate transporter, partial [Cellulomonas sp.]|nr:gluconate transporter [Cellulomonas sp.]